MYGYGFRDYLFFFFVYGRMKVDLLFPTPLSEIRSREARRGIVRRDTGREAVLTSSEHSFHAGMASMHNRSIQLLH